MSATPITLWHNPRCSKSRRAHELLVEAGVDVHVVDYLDAPPSRDELTAVLRKLGKRPADILRKGEAIVKELQLDVSDDDAVLAAMLEHPILIERPIAIVADAAVVGRPPETVLELIGSS
jgi:arsenate reductase